MKVLVIEDSLRLQRTVQLALRKSGFVVDATGDGQEGLWMAQSHPYDTIILDLMLPGMDGLSLLRKLRERDDGTPVLILTVKAQVEDRVEGLRSGADDYLAKPFALEELVARVESLVRRKYGTRTQVLRIGELMLNLSAKTVHCAGELVDLTPREFRLLEFLMLHSGQVVSRSEIERHVYQEETELFSNVVESAVSILRRKLEAVGCPALIQTRRGLGYILES